ncbi:MAG: hypothetical protein OEM67_06260, partial [Thermoleophilia bacterium]|nr:hypothetical protein [Thermoleophilia bacterium]
MPVAIASFQARSAFSGAGFTTTEAENVVNHPVRRRIITTTMFVGTLGTPTLVVTIVIGLVAPGPGSTTERSLVAVAGLVALVMLVVNRPMTRYLEAFGRRYAQRRLLPAVHGAAQELLSLGDDFTVIAARLQEGVEGSPRSLRGIEHALPRVRVLGVRTDRAFVGEAPADLTLHAEDELVVYGRRERLVELGLLGGE